MTSSRLRTGVVKEAKWNIKELKENLEEKDEQVPLLLTRSSFSSSNSNPNSVYSNCLSDAAELFQTRNSILDVKQQVIYFSKYDTNNNLVGFYHFAWIVLSFYVLSTFSKNFFEFGYLLNGYLARQYFSDFKGLLLIEGFLLMFSGLIFGIVFIFPICKMRSLIVASMQVGLVIIGCSYGFIRNWSGLQRAIFTLHVFTLLMKIHAFIRCHYHIKPEISLIQQKFKSFFLFLNAPTLIYSDFYPRTPK
jgi:hypothetical protein